MAAGARCSPTNWETQRDPDATDYSVTRTVRIPQSHHGPRAGWRDRIFPARLEPLDRHRALPDFARRGQSRVDGIACATRARWTLHSARFIWPVGLFANERRGGKCVARFNQAIHAREPGIVNRRILRQGILREGAARQMYAR